MPEHLAIFIPMNKLTTEKRVAVIKALAEGNSIRATVRLTGAAKDTVTKLLVQLGNVCTDFQDRTLVNLPCKRIEADEIWAFVGAKARNATQPGHGDIWTFTAVDPDTKLAVSWLVGPRSQESATAFMQDIAARMANRIQLTTDGHYMYPAAVRQAFAFARVDFAQLAKTYGQSGETGPARRYSPAVVTGAVKQRVIGRPDMDLVSTSYVERANLTMRMQMRRFTRLTNAFSKKAENHAHAVALHFMYCNFCRPHGTLTKAKGGIHTTPAMAAGIADHVWKVEEIVALLD